MFYMFYGDFMEGSTSRTQNVIYVKIMESRNHLKLSIKKFYKMWPNIFSTQPPIKASWLL